MIGAHSFVGDANSLTFKWKAKARNGATAVKITLEPSDTYSMKFYALKRTGGVLRAAVVDEAENVYAEDLRRIFEQTTGLRLSLGTLGR